MSDSEPNIIKEFRGLYDYVRRMGESIIQIHDRIEKLEKSINEIKSNNSNYIRDSTLEITNIKENMVNKHEFSDLIEKMKASMSEKLPPLPTIVKETSSTN